MYKIDGVIRGHEIFVVVHALSVQTITLDLLLDLPGEPASLRRACQLGAITDSKGTYQGRVDISDCLAMIDGVRPHLYVNDSLVADADINDAGWQLSTLCVRDKEIFNRIMRYTYQRISDPETLMWMSLKTALAPETELRIRMTSFVVFCYRAIDLERRDILQQFLPEFDHFEAVFHLIRPFKTGSVRDVGEQVILSVQSVRWHVLVFLARYAEAEMVLDSIVRMGRDNTDYHTLPFATNYANAAVLRAYLQFRRNTIPTEDDNPVRDFYAQFRHIMAKLPNEIPAYNYMREFIAVCEKMALGADIEWLLSRRVRKAIVDGTADLTAQRRLEFAEKAYTPLRVYKACSRVQEGEAFRAAFLAFCEAAVPAV